MADREGVGGPAQDGGGEAELTAEQLAFAKLHELLRADGTLPQSVVDGLLTDIAGVADSTLPGLANALRELGDARATEAHPR